MKRFFVLFNPASGNSTGEKNAHRLDSIIDGELIYLNITKLNCSDFSEKLEENDSIVLCGGDGTLNRFINDVDCDSLNNDLYLFPSGSGNDFLLDIGYKKPAKPIKINDYIKNLPIISVNGKDYKFINGAGAGIDGYCCYVCDQVRKKENKNVSYMSVALKGIIKSFAPINAKLTVDGKEYNFKKMWLSPIMKGRFCGGGFMLAPNQKRSYDSLTFVTAHNVSRLKLLTILPTALFGKHVKFKKNVECISGKEFSVEFETPTILQVDGEAYENVKEFKVSTKLLKYV